MMRAHAVWNSLAAVALLTTTLVVSRGATSAQSPYGRAAETTVASQAPSLAGTPTVVSAAGAGPDDIQATVDQYRALLGDPNNGGAPGVFPAGRREINWDGVPDQFAAPNFLPNDFFNAATPPGARGAVFSTPGTGVQVSANSVNPTYTPVRFGNINPSYVALFQTFSPERLFSPIGSNIVDMTFFVPGTQTPAEVRGFGAVYTNVAIDHTAFEYFDKDGQSLGQFNAPLAPGGLSFLGVVWDQPVVARVRIAYGTGALGPDDSPTYNVAVMDDFIYAEPQAIP
jgi:hypothetical protein